ncbi:hypothetical protein [Halolamina sp.]|jgi:hypothetical protein|uniref:hypothetical protein n=1 Tax=Halolamina sp. TaxID=1940283 RepID=UPI000223B4A9|nr:hypothetical protein Halar_0980 [halophilic archaeon DL31]
MSGVPKQPNETERSYRLDRWAGLTIVGSIVLSLVLVSIGEPLFWVPFAAGLGIGLPAFAILADREREQTNAVQETGDEGDAEDV